MMIARILLTAALLPMLAAGPAPAAPVSEPLSAGTGNAGVAIAYDFAGRLGTTGLEIEAMPTMLLIKAIAAGSPAALLDLPSPERYRVRLAAINGRPVEELTLRELQALFNPKQEKVTLTLARKAPSDLAEALVGPYELPLSNAGIASLQSRWLAAQRRFTEAHSYLADRQTKTDGLADNLLLAARDLAAAGDYPQALALVAKIDADSELFTEVLRLQARWRIANLNAQLGRADALAGQGQFSAALGVLSHLAGDESWSKIKESREVQWKSALTQRQAYKTYKHSEYQRRAREYEAARRVRQAEIAAYRRELERRYGERLRLQQASRSARRGRGR